MAGLTKDYRIDANKRYFASAAIGVIRGYILRNAEGAEVSWILGPKPVLERAG